MHQTIGRLLGSAVLSTTALVAPAQAVSVIDFESAVLTGLYFPGETFTQGDFVLTTQLDFGSIDVAAALGVLAPSGNASQFYFNSNDGRLSLQRSDAGAFSLTGFSAAFVQLDPPSAQTTVIVARGTTVGNALVTASWQFAPSNTSNFPFTAYSGGAFAAFDNVTKVDFYACSWIGNVACTAPTLNNGQFAIDDIMLGAPVPEPVPALLLTLGLAGLALRARRRQG